VTQGITGSELEREETRGEERDNKVKMGRQSLVDQGKSSVFALWDKNIVGKFIGNKPGRASFPVGRIEGRSSEKVESLQGGTDQPN